MAVPVDGGTTPVGWIWGAYQGIRALAGPLGDQIPRQPEADEPYPESNPYGPGGIYYSDAPLPPITLEPGERLEDLNEYGEPIGSDSDVERRWLEAHPGQPLPGPERPAPPAVDPMSGVPSDADNMMPRWSGPYWGPAGGRRRGGKRGKRRTKRKNPYRAPLLGFVGTLPTVTQAASGAVATAAATIARVLPWLAVLWPADIEPDFQPAPSGPTRRRRGTVLDPTDPYPSRRERYDSPPQPMIPAPDWQPWESPLEVPAPYVPPRPVILPRVDVPPMPTLPGVLPEIPTLPAPATRPAPAPSPRRVPAPGPGPSPFPLPGMPALPDLWPFLPLLLPGSRPGSRPSTPAFPTPRSPASPLPLPTNPVFSDPFGTPLTTPLATPLPFSQPAPARSPYDDCVATLKRRPKTRKCVQRDECGRCTKYRKL